MPDERPQPMGPRGRRIVVALAVAGFTAATIAWATTPFGGRLVVLLGIDRSGWWFLCALFAAGTLSVALAAIAYVNTGARTPLLRFLLANLLILALGGAWLLGGWAVLLIGALSLSTSYRTVGVVEGREVVLSTGVPLGELPVQAGLRDGPYVDLRGSAAVRGDWLPLDRWTVHVAADGPDVVVRFRAHRRGAEQEVIVPGALDGS